MNNNKDLSDFDHPLIREKAKELTSGKSTVIGKVESIFLFMRDEIRFGFPPKWDQVKASETLQYRLGYCNTKAICFHALCKSIGIPTRIHTGLIRVEIMRGIFPGFAFPFMPVLGGHSWLEIEIGGEWKSIDSYINDKPFYENALKQLQESGKTTAFSISLDKGASSCEFNFGEKGFVHMGAVAEDHGTWDDFSEYMSSDVYPRMNWAKLTSMKIISKIANANIKRIRSS